MRIHWMLALLALACAGCTAATDSEVSSAGSESTGAGGAPPPAASMPESLIAPIPGAGGVGGEAAGGSETDTAPPKPPVLPGAFAPGESSPGLPPGLVPAGGSQQDGTRVKAETGVGKRGQGLKNETGVIVESAKALLGFEQKAVFDIQIPSAMKLFEATNGRKPKSNAEFMSQIIKSNRINLPTLPAGQRYEYDPQRGELMVIRPAG